MQELKLIALDVEDLAVVSAQLQDAVVRVEDIAFLKGPRQFAMIANRFNWMTALRSAGGDAARGLKVGKQASFERRRCVIRFECVNRIQLQGIDLSDKRRVLSLLAISFNSAGEEGPEGALDLIFSGGAILRLHVECIEGELRDLGAAWSTRAVPRHETDAPESSSS